MCHRIRHPPCRPQRGHIQPLDLQGDTRPSTFALRTLALAHCLAVLGDRRAAVARELTKLHEEIVSGTISTLIDHFSSANLRGEFVLIIDREREDDSPAETAEQALKTRVRELQAAGEDSRSAMKRAAKELGITRSEAYRILQGLDGER